MSLSVEQLAHALPKTELHVPTRPPTHLGQCLLLYYGL